MASGGCAVSSKASGCTVRLHLAVHILPALTKVMVAKMARGAVLTTECQEGADQLLGLPSSQLFFGQGYFYFFAVFVSGIELIGRLLDPYLMSKATGKAGWAI